MCPSGKWVPTEGQEAPPGVPTPCHRLGYRWVSISTLAKAQADPQWETPGSPSCMPAGHASPGLSPLRVSSRCLCACPHPSPLHASLSTTSRYSETFMLPLPHTTPISTAKPWLLSFPLSRMFFGQFFARPGSSHGSGLHRNAHFIRDI